jgi:SAM-dependent methyltransferase
MSSALNDQVREFWEVEPCGTAPEITGLHAPLSPEWFEAVERYRYAVEPCIHAVAQFTRHSGKKLLEVGVGAGTDHLQWARAGADCYGVDLTDAGIETTRARLANYGYSSNLRRTDAESLPFPDETFDLVYSWGVIHHAERPQAIVEEIRRVLRPGGTFIGMMYARHSLVAARFWLRFAFLRGRPWRSVSDVIWEHMESVGTKAYTVAELRRMFGAFQRVAVDKVLTPHDTRHLPAALTPWLPNALGWFITITADK